ncbi:predicted protein [Sclerotinia sclerotiorum 1980 UF-70]|uniref:Uncharacterized protein n=1 Tax=Sclerotinia sclerotiorum (strain ATCC 18683 / 1980 / Ss-1) TaxID=665079 RepID=A7ETW5_SCLS1|nr:predicted protein [Sclerotinia sclerotiorum 1980 UF-70]EDN92907.1 predicted protein [Sclerotinia sclerotiorum 1980 UF-70]
MIPLASSKGSANLGGAPTAAAAAGGSDDAKACS